uniref:Putative LAGLIDADG homing endonuclease n=1 Tax=Stephanosphaera pluvialis TaxID=51712 RepID=A0A0S2ID94_9CHLO|nr:putative LAGLIDADG homing endonuclease [Stephanosphaera pluvialis]
MTTLSQLQKDCIFGTLLGDGNLQTENQGRTWRYRAIHKNQHKSYLLHKYEILKPLCSSPPAYGEVFDTRTEKTYKRNYFNTTQQSSLKFFGDMFYSYDQKVGKWVKDVPLNVEKFLTPAALAYFYMDDGALKWLNNSNAMRICTESFSHHGVKRLQKALIKNYKVDTTLTKKTLKDGTFGYRIAIPEKSSTAFRDIINSHLVDCMKYKVSDGNKGHL